MGTGLPSEVTGHSQLIVFGSYTNFKNTKSYRTVYTKREAGCTTAKLLLIIIINNNNIIIIIMWAGEMAKWLRALGYSSQHSWQLTAM